MNGSGCIRAGVVGGTRLPGNVRKLLENIRRLLADHPVTFNLELLVDDAVDAPDGYEVVDPGFGSPNRALGTLKTLTSGLTRYLKNNKLDILFQVTKFPVHGCAAAVAGRRTNTPVLARLAGDNFREFRVSSGLHKIKAFGLNNVIGRVPVHWSNRIIVLGPYGRSEIESRTGNTPVEEIPQPIDRDRFAVVSDGRERELAQKLGFPTEKRVLLTVGRLTERKGMGTLIEAAEILSQRNESFRWYVLGEGPMREELEAASGVKPLGRVDFAQMPQYYQAADLVVHPSLIDGLPNVLLEAAACETPTLARNVGDSALVASATFEKTVELSDMVTAEYEPAALPDQFEEDQLRRLYAKIIVNTSETGRAAGRGQ